MKKIIGFVRKNDSELFSLNDDGTFSLEKMKVDFPDSLHMKYDKESLKSSWFIPIYEKEI